MIFIITQDYILLINFIVKDVMKKIIVTIDAINYNEQALKYAIQIAKQSGGMILGVFLHDISYVYADLPGIFDLVPVEYSTIIKRQQEDHDKLNANMHLFNEACKKENVRHKIHAHDEVNVTDFLIKESMFADMLIVDEQISFAIQRADSISTFLTDILEDAHCPVLVVPEKYSPIEQVFLCYDGSPSGTKAIKMYSYIFSEWSAKNTTLISFNAEASAHISNSENIKDLLHQHFSNLTIDVEHEKRQEDSMLSYFKLREENALIVMGAYGRSPFSRLFRKSAANNILKNLKAPIFITHE